MSQCALTTAKNLTDKLLWKWEQAQIHPLEFVSGDQWCGMRSCGLHAQSQRCQSSAAVNGSAVIVSLQRPKRSFKSIRDYYRYQWYLYDTFICNLSLLCFSFSYLYEFDINSWRNKKGMRCLSVLQVISDREAALLFRYLHHLRSAVLRVSRNPDPAGGGALWSQMGIDGRPQYPRGSCRPHMWVKLQHNTRTQQN